MARKGSPSSVAFVTKGTYQREPIDIGAATSWIAGTEVEIPIAAYIKATAAAGDQLFSWIRVTMYAWELDAKMLFEWAIVKQEQGLAMPNLDSSDDMEKLHKEGRLFARGLLYVPHPTHKVPPVKVELYNVIIDDGDELVMVYKPWITGAANAARVMGMLEYRQVGA